MVRRPDGDVALGRLGALVESVATLCAEGRQVLLVSSGAIGLGWRRLGFDRRPTALVDQLSEMARELADFTEGSILDFGAEENLFIDKLGSLMPWFVNSRLARFRESPASARYAPLVERVLAMDEREWAAFKPDVRRVDAELAAAAVAAGEEHYAIRYNAFMGVRSDFYLAEERGLEWTTASAKPSVELHEAAREDASVRREAALAAAAAEVC